LNKEIPSPVWYESAPFSFFPSIPASHLPLLFGEDIQRPFRVSCYVCGRGVIFFFNPYFFSFPCVARAPGTSVLPTSLPFPLGGAGRGVISPLGVTVRPLPLSLELRHSFFDLPEFSRFKQDATGLTFLAYRLRFDLLFIFFFFAGGVPAPIFFSVRFLFPPPFSTVSYFAFPTSRRFSRPRGVGGLDHLFLRGSRSGAGLFPFFLFRRSGHSLGRQPLPRFFELGQPPVRLSPFSLFSQV